MALSSELADITAAIAESVQQDMMIAMLGELQGASAACTRVCLQRLQDFHVQMLTALDEELQQAIQSKSETSEEKAHQVGEALRRRLKLTSNSKVCKSQVFALYDPEEQDDYEETVELFRPASGRSDLEAMYSYLDNPDGPQTPCSSRGALGSFVASPPMWRPQPNGRSPRQTPSRFSVSRAAAPEGASKEAEARRVHAAEQAKESPGGAAAQAVAAVGTGVHSAQQSPGSLVEQSEPLRPLDIEETQRRLPREQEQRNLEGSSQLSEQQRHHARREQGTEQPIQDQPLQRERSGGQQQQGRSRLVEPEEQRQRMDQGRHEAKVQEEQESHADGGPTVHQRKQEEQAGARPEEQPAEQPKVSLAAGKPQGREQSQGRLGNQAARAQPAQAAEEDEVLLAEECEAQRIQEEQEDVEEPDHEDQLSHGCLVESQLEELQEDLSLQVQAKLERWSWQGSPAPGDARSSVSTESSERDGSLSIRSPSWIGRTPSTLSDPALDGLSTPGVSMAVESAVEAVPEAEVSQQAQPKPRALAFREPEEKAQEIALRWGGKFHHQVRMTARRAAPGPVEDKTREPALVLAPAPAPAPGPSSSEPRAQSAKPCPKSPQHIRSQRPEAHQDIWIVSGGMFNGGIKVREGQDIMSEELPERLESGAFVRALEYCRCCSRMRYELIVGRGPQTGWVSTRFKGQDLLTKKKSKPKAAAKRRSKSRVSAIQEAEVPAASPAASAAAAEASPARGAGPSASEVAAGGGQGSPGLWVCEECGKEGKGRARICDDCGYFMGEPPAGEWDLPLVPPLPGDTA